MSLPQNRKAIPLGDIVCGTSYIEFKSPVLQCQSCTICYHQIVPKCHCIMGLNNAQSSLKFQCKQCTEQLVEPYWIDTAHLFRDCYNNGSNIENKQT